MSGASSNWRSAKQQKSPAGPAPRTRRGELAAMAPHVTRYSGAPQDLSLGDEDVQIFRVRRGRGLPVGIRRAQAFELLILDAGWPS